MAKPINTEFDLRGVNHLALVCRDMKKTVEFYRDKLGMPLLKTIELPRGMGQHFFFGLGNGDAIAFFSFPDSPKAAPGIAAPAALPTQGSIASAHGSMNHIAIDVPPEKFDEYVKRLKEKGIETTAVFNHDDSPSGAAEEMHDGVFERSVYFFDPDGICLEFAAWTRDLNENDVRHELLGAIAEAR